MPPVWRLEGTPTYWISIIPSSAIASGRPSSSSSGSTTKGVTENTLSKSIRTEESGEGCPGTLPLKDTPPPPPRGVDVNKDAQRKRARVVGVERSDEVSKPFSDVNALREPSRAIFQKQNPEAEESNRMENREHWGWAKRACLVFSRNWRRDRHAWPSSSPLGTTSKNPGIEKSKVSDHAPSENKKTTSRCLGNRGMEHTPIKKLTQSGEWHHQAMSA